MSASAMIYDASLKHRYTSTVIEGGSNFPMPPLCPVDSFFVWTEGSKHSEETAREKTAEGKWGKEEAPSLASPWSSLADFSPFFPSIERGPRLHSGPYAYGIGITSPRSLSLPGVWPMEKLKLRFDPVIHNVHAFRF